MNRRPDIRSLALAGALIGSLVAAAPALAITPAEVAPAYGFGSAAPAAGYANPWPECATATQQYCVESATINGLPANRRAWIRDDSVGPGQSAQLSWQLEPGLSWAAGGTARMVIRVGRFQPRYTAATADGIAVVANSTDGGNFTLDISGRLTDFAWNFSEGFTCLPTTCGDSTSRATVSGLGFAGVSQDMAGSAWAGNLARFTGMAVATNAQVVSGSVAYESSPGKAWSIQVANPHLTEAGAPASGPFAAYVPASYFTQSGIDPTSTTFSVSRTNGASTAPIAATVTPDLWGGATVRIDSLAYGNPLLRFLTVPRTAPVTIGKPVVTVKASSIAVSAAVRVSGKGRVLLSGVTGGGDVSTTRCAAPARSFARAGTATITCTIGRAGRNALKASAMMLAVRAAFSPSGGASTTTVRPVLIARKG